VLYGEKVMSQKNKFRMDKSWGFFLLAISIVCLLSSFVLFIFFGAKSDEDWTFFMLFVNTLSGILPAGIVFYLSEKLIVMFLNLLNMKLSNLFAILIGLAVGFILIEVTNLVLWLQIKPILFRLSFVDFLFPRNLADFRAFTDNINSYLIPSIFNFVFSGYMGWKTNKLKSAIIS
jgi:hypothetical protein